MASQIAKTILEEMTIQEKIGQLIQLSGDFFQNGTAAITGPLKEHHLSLETIYTAGSVLGISGAERVRQVQTDFLKHSRLKIPLLFMADVVHGYQTIFPIPLALGATFDPQTMHDMAAVAAKESAAGGVHVTFAPMVDLVRDPRWGRVMESTGEDPYLNSVMAKAAVNGFQGKLPLDANHIAACVKHFAAYGAPEAGREYNTVDISEWRFREQYLPAYAAAIEAESLLVMTSFNTLFGIPATANQKLMRDILRQELDFKGVLISDWDAIGETIAHGVAGNLEAAADLSLEAGVDIDMMSFAYAKYLEKAANLDEHTKLLIDEAVVRILDLKVALGLFEDPYRGLSVEREATTILSSDNLHVAEQAAEKSMVLLKNESVLPLATDAKVALVGPGAHTGDLLGSWSWQGDPQKTSSIYDEFKSRFKSVEYAKGCGFHALNYQELDQAVMIGRDSDVIVAVVGLPSSETGEATSLTQLTLPTEQLTLLKQLAALNKPLITVVLTGRPLDLTAVAAVSSAIVLAWYPGSRGAAALTNILTGEVNPSGKLPMSFPRHVGQVPIYYNHYNTGRPISQTADDDENKYLSKYVDAKNEPLYPFGYGLSYADLAVEQLKVLNPIVNDSQNLQVGVTITNHSTISATTVIQVYSHQLVGQTVRPVKELKYFERLSLAPLETRDILVTLPLMTFRSMQSNLQWQVEDGDYTVMVGLDSDNVLQQPFEIRANNKRGQE